ncbi:hypothetical protein [Nocardioides piscis]|uniref:Uncharacterized protein n=1 Tax=Nocardioides piscis TaxID=2714938 RepID=A0A6G7YGV6_9ACTN|nr:hypothetical protein [Nocardioides piscis]QIK75847.1 hypothetical protein G7071_10730 [Nocardioides piscis]
MRELLRHQGVLLNRSLWSWTAVVLGVGGIIQGIYQAAACVGDGCSPGGWVAYAVVPLLAGCAFLAVGLAWDRLSGSDDIDR